MQVFDHASRIEIVTAEPQVLRERLNEVREVIKKSGLKDIKFSAPKQRTDDRNGDPHRDPERQPGREEESENEKDQKESKRPVFGEEVEVCGRTGTALENWRVDTAIRVE